ncbi:hypothetical protein LOK49_LG07G01661 [Camellia lanceoleosa]|uniref:Uncharacterized protein n=2 Tax=Camellia lanceoleosa TaxID=1840588 RepID=A0ACC0H7I5_9ERIC|nr:hypothetical protein LOK49_LG07G01676 [Camellia lanceoleosa]KAI8008782.1 hypothetical protein LOK49_LG07G01661 [Camellia lanceoleosa]
MTKNKQSGQYEKVATYQQTVKSHAKVDKLSHMWHTVTLLFPPINYHKSQPRRNNFLTTLLDHLFSSMANSAFLAVSFCLLVLCNSCLAVRPSRQLQQQQQQYQQGECRIQNLNPLEPNRRIQHEAGITEIWDQNNDQSVPVWPPLAIR